MDEIYTRNLCRNNNMYNFFNNIKEAKKKDG